MTGTHEHDFHRRVEEATGEFLPGTSIEIFSDWLSRLSDPIDTIVRVYNSSGTPVPYHSSDTSSTDIAVNDDFNDGSGQPSTDPVLINLTLPSTGNFSDARALSLEKLDPSLNLC